MEEDEQKVVMSGKCQTVTLSGYPFSVEIYRLETESLWTLEVVDCDGTSHVWDDQFRSDKDARTAALEAIRSEGPIAFMRGSNVIPFSQD